jgi:hypothetical protein
MSTLPTNRSSTISREFAANAASAKVVGSLENSSMPAR